MLLKQLQIENNQASLTKTTYILLTITTDYFTQWVEDIIIHHMKGLVNTAQDTQRIYTRPQTSAGILAFI